MLIVDVLLAFLAISAAIVFLLFVLMYKFGVTFGVVVVLIMTLILQLHFPSDEERISAQQARVPILVREALTMLFGRQQ